VNVSISPSVIAVRPNGVSAQIFYDQNAEWKKRIDFVCRTTNS
jgi:hypothetical protein